MKNTAFPKRLHQQRGMTLVVGLIMVLLMTLVGMAAIRGSNMQELMAGNMRDHNLALQAAEAALRAGEARVQAVDLPAFGTTQYPELMMALDQGGSSEYWKSYDWAEARTAELGLSGVARQPEYVVEEVTSLTSLNGADGGGIDVGSRLIQNDKVIYRISSRGFGGSESTQVLLQSTFRQPK
ncbi:hypothetical protein JF535_05705 [Microbulbifer salipaludis]|uniref:Type IV pilus assembly protein PilX n=1 Tax=Microbulbifer salipaludis TaxID=187980 RepID=A0ABS3E563_9GAMM|nr:PilX N-terminal domain-containing pilus assembly protein [Microbulbifer salipaludis]MBN8430348.1 hypothetical protein [Microbulbifer salipaludis]